MQFDLSSMIKIIIRRRHQIRHTWFTPVCFYRIHSFVILELFAWIEQKKVQINREKAESYISNGKFSTNLIVDLDVFFNFIVENMRQHWNAQPSYILFALHISMSFKHESDHKHRNETACVEFSIHFAIFCCVIYLLFMFFFVWVFFSQHSHSE